MYGCTNMHEEDLWNPRRVHVCVPLIKIKLLINRRGFFFVHDKSKNEWNPLISNTNYSAFKKNF